MHLGHVQLALRKLSEAHESYAVSLDARRRVLGEQHALTAVSCFHVGHALAEMKRFEDAERAYVSALEIRKVALGETHPDTARSYYNLAVLLHHERDQKPRA